MKRARATGMHNDVSGKGKRFFLGMMDGIIERVSSSMYSVQNHSLRFARRRKVMRGPGERIRVVNVT